ncbi:hypothetical protein E2C01_086453 [Portunus trituberculatus]|uniref:Uncharacterized protein n=1 Tax=Portunus trituberculatus TaxID=210409 RepID=A0A5B7JEM4_PORTR|nr:hypothetical protein [Portunus trituberculatus]
MIELQHQQQAECKCCGLWQGKQTPPASLSAVIHGFISRFSANELRVSLSLWQRVQTQLATHKNEPRETLVRLA